MLASRCVALSELTNQPVTEDTVVRLSASLRAESVLISTAWISILLGQLPPGQLELSVATQRMAAQVLCPARVAGLLAVLGDGRHETWLYEQQLLLASKAAILNGQPGPPTGVGRTGVGELLLGISDILDQDANEVIENYRGERERLDIGLRVRQRALFPNEQPRYVIGRYYDLLVTRSRDYRHHSEWRDVHKYFKRQTGLTIEQFIVRRLNACKNLRDCRGHLKGHDTSSPSRANLTCGN